MKGDLQLAIWTLLEDDYEGIFPGPFLQCRVDEILDEAYANGEEYEPECGDVAAIILVPFDPEVAQYTLIPVEVPCTPVYCDETAWGEGPEFIPDEKDWSMYIVYNEGFGRNEQQPIKSVFFKILEKRFSRIATILQQLNLI